MQDPINELITFLQQKGLTQEEIATECENLTWQASDKFHEELMSILIPEDKQAIDAIGDDLEAEAEMKRRYVARTAKDPQDVMRDILTQQAKQVMREYDTSSSMTAQ
ncbi:MAG: hypothetical protein AAB478_04405 [Patescibacteria group bacterium]